jgi:hypothetical protein
MSGEDAPMGAPLNHGEFCPCIACGVYHPGLIQRKILWVNDEWGAGARTGVLPDNDTGRNTGEIGKGKVRP